MTFTREQLEEWLYEIVKNNIDTPFGDSVEEIISRIDGFEIFVKEMADNASEMEEGMTREEAKKLIFREWQSFLENYIDYGGVSDAYKMALNALEQEPCEDCISRKAVINAIYANGVWENEYNLTSRRIKKAVEALPSIQPMRPKGEWLQQQGENGDDYFEAWDISGVHTYAARYKCSICGFIQYCIEDHGHYHFCPSCGADMRGGE